MNMKRLMITAFTALLMTGLVSACAIQNDSTPTNEIGYQKCTSDEECLSLGICFGYSDRPVPDVWVHENTDGTSPTAKPVPNLPFGYCVAQCVIGEDCLPIVPIDNKPLFCTYSRCEQCIDDEDCDPTFYGLTENDTMVCSDANKCVAAQ